MIRSFKDGHLEAFFRIGKRHRSIPQVVEAQLRRRLQILDDSTCRRDLASMPSNRLHALEAPFKGEESISVNDHWRIHFTWDEAAGEASEVYLYDHNYRSRR